MKPIAAFFRLFILLVIAVLLAPAVRAEADYEYAKQLMELSSASFSTDDLVERLAARLEESQAPVVKMEAKLIRATLLQRQARELPPEKRVEKLKQASDYYKELAASGEKKLR